MMKIQVLGGHGGSAKGFATTSFLVDEKLLLDAGAVASALNIEDQKKIESILISHCHLDHIKDLAFICDNCFGLKSEPFKVYTHPTVKKIVKEHLLNDIVWPDFTKIPNAQNPTMEIFERIPEEAFEASGYKIIPVSVNHPHDAMGFIIEQGSSAVLFTLDTGPTSRIWEVGKKIKNLKAIFTEVSFPNSLQKIADLSQHHTPQSLKTEISKMPQGVPIILTHLKPNYRDEILKELAQLDERRITVLEKDGESFNF